MLLCKVGQPQIYSHVKNGLHPLSLPKLDYLVISIFDSLTAYIGINRLGAANQKAELIISKCEHPYKCLLVWNIQVSVDAKTGLSL